MVWHYRAQYVTPVTSRSLPSHMALIGMPREITGVNVLQVRSKVPHQSWIFGKVVAQLENTPNIDRERSAGLPI